MSKTIEYLMAHKDLDNPYWIAPRMVFADGFSVSVQAHRGSYATPRDEHGPWFEVELGFPSERPNDEIMKYVEDADNPTGTVYGYVPIDAVDRLIEQHGGIANAPEIG